MIYPTTNDKAAEERLDEAMESLRFWGDRTVAVLDDLDGCIPEEFGADDAEEAAEMIERAAYASSVLSKVLTNVREVVHAILEAEERGGTDCGEAAVDGALARLRACAREVVRELDEVDSNVLKGDSEPVDALNMLERADAAVCDLLDALGEADVAITSMREAE